MASARERLRYALFLADAFSVHPVAKSTTVRVRQNSPRALGPQWATVSASTLPGSPSSSSPAFLMVIELRSSSPAGRVVAIPLGRAASRTGLRYRSTVAALIVMSSSNVDPSYASSSPHARSMGSHWGSIVFRYLPHGMSIITHTSRSSSLERSEYRLGRSAGTASLCVRRPAWASRRLAVLLPIPSDSHILSRMTPFCFFDALTYSSLNLRVTCLFAAMLIPSSIRPAKQTNPVSRSLLLRHHYAIRAQKT